MREAFVVPTLDVLQRPVNFCIIPNCSSSKGRVKRIRVRLGGLCTVQLSILPRIENTTLTPASMIPLVLCSIETILSTLRRRGIVSNWPRIRPHVFLRRLASKWPLKPKFVKRCPLALIDPI